jgi:hypothetical protein
MPSHAPSLRIASIVPSVRRRLPDGLGLDAVRIGATLRNIPPAAVYRITRQSRSPAAEV